MRQVACFTGRSARFEAYGGPHLWEYRPFAAAGADPRCGRIRTEQRLAGRIDS
jgi:hypothetical protein